MFDIYNMIGYSLILIGFLITLGAQIYLYKTLSQYKHVESKKNKSGAEVARDILDKNKLDDVYVVEINGVLGDHYDPNRKVVRLSKEIFNGTSITAVSVAAREVAHAIQDKENNSIIKIRSFCAPILNYGIKFGYIVIILGSLAGYLNLVWAGVGLLLLILLFQLVTLSSEFEASEIARRELKSSKIVGKSEVEDSDLVLKAASYTYVASLITTILEVVGLALSFLNGDNRR